MQLDSTMKSKRDREEPCYICSHYHDFDGGEPCSTCGHVLSAQEKKLCESVMPTCIVPGFLYLGSYDTASRSEMLKAMAISHILNTVPKCVELYKNTFTYHTLQASPPDFQECFDFIDSVQQKSEGKVLIYCMSGLSRSPCIVIAYLMKARGWRLLESFKWVKEKRASIQLNSEDQKRLIDFELHLYNGCSIPNGFDSIETTGTGMFGVPSSAMERQSPEPAMGQGNVPAFSVPPGHTPWVFPSGSSGAASSSGQSIFGLSGGGDAGMSFVFGSPQGGTQPVTNSEMEM